MTNEYILNEEKVKEAIQFSPHVNQQEILDNLRRFTCITAGRRFGKTLIASYLAFKELLLQDRVVWIVAPTYDLAKKTWRYVFGWVARECPNMRINQSNLTIECPETGSRLELRTGDNHANCIGEGVDLLIVDEASRIKDLIWNEALYPTLADKQGRAVLISTPRGKNWFYHMYLKGKQHEDYASFTFQTKDNLAIPHLEQEQEEARRQLPEASYRQEYLAEFLEDSGQVFRGITDCISGTLEEPRKEKSYVMGIDLAKYEDYTVLTVMDLTTFHVVAFERFNKIDWEFQRTRIKTLADKYRKAALVVDSTGVGDPIAESLKRDGYLVKEYKYTNATKKYLIENLALKIQRKEVTFPEIPELLNELQSFGYEYTPSRNLVYNAPDGLHDDCVNSLALAVYGCGHYTHSEVHRPDPFPAGSLGQIKKQFYDKQNAKKLKHFV